MLGLPKSIMSAGVILIACAGASVAFGQAAGQPAGQAAAKEDFHAEVNRKYAVLEAQGQPKDGPNAQPLIGKIGKQLGDVSDQVSNGQKKAAGIDAYADFGGLGMFADPGADKKDAELAQLAIKKLSNTQMFAEIAAIAKATRYESEMGRGLMTLRMIPELGQARRITRLNIGRASLAMEAKKQDEFVARIDETLAIGSHVSNSPTLISSLVGIAVQAKAFDTVRRAVATGTLDDVSLTALAKSIESRKLADPVKAIRGEQLMAEDLTDFVRVGGPNAMAAVKDMDKLDKAFEAGKIVLDRSKPFYAEEDSLGGDMPNFKTQKVLINEVYDDIARQVNISTKQRLASPTSKELKAKIEKNLILALIVPALSKSVQALDQWRADRVGTLTIIALERYKLKNGVYPNSLDALVPAFLSAAPVDPYSEGSLGYLAPTKGPNNGLYQGGREYVLYAAWLDTKDSGGAINFENRFRSKASESEGKDFLLNDVAPTIK